jgi:TolB protein
MNFKLLLMLLSVFASSLFAQHRIAYNVAQDSKSDDYEVYSMNLDGSDKRNITNHKDVAWTYYAYKDRLFFISDRDACKRCYFLYEMKADGTNVRKISDLRLEDSWMGSRNDGAEMIVSARVGDDVRMQLFVIDTAIGKFRQLTDENGAAFRDPSFSPDGKQIIYAHKKDRKSREETEELWIMNVDGSDRRKLTTYPADDKTAEWHDYHAGPPRWVAAHGFITYQSVQKGKSSLFAITPDGKKNWKLTDSKLSEGWHDWSPDGKWLAVEITSETEPKNYEIWLMNYETKEIKKLTDPKDFRVQQAPVFVEFDEKSATEIVEEFVAAYNKHDIPAMMSLVADDIKWFSIDGGAISAETKDSKELRTFLEGYFKNCTTCKSTISGLNQKGNTVSFFETTAGGQTSLAVYEVEDGKIQTVYYFPAFKASAEKYDAGLAKRLGADDYGMKTYVFAILKTGKAKLEKTERDKLVQGHLANIGKLAEAGKLVVAGPYLEDDESRGIFISDVRTKEEAKKLVETDPAVKAGVFEVELRLWYGSAALLELKNIYPLLQKKRIL